MRESSPPSYVESDEATHDNDQDERDGGASSRALVLGNIVHGLLEDLTTTNPPEFEEAFTAHAASRRLDLLGAPPHPPEMAQIMAAIRAQPLGHFRLEPLGPVLDGAL